MKNTITDWNGYKQINFEVDGRKSFIVCPKEPIKGNFWVWRTEFFGAFDYADCKLLENGWFLAYTCVSDMYGCPKAIDMMYEFYKTAITEYHLNPKPALFGFSRGGLYAVNFALKHPKLTGLLYLDAPVLDIKSWPGGKGTGVGEEQCWEECKNWYGLTEETALEFKNNPLDNTEKLAETKIPVFLVCGGVDKIVPYSENGEIFFERYKKANGIIEQILKPDCDHHPHSLSDPTPIVDFIENALLPKKDKTFGNITMNVLGDSITYGAYTAPGDDCPSSVVENPWCSLVAEKLGFKAVNNYGGSGTSISSTSTVLPESAFSKRYTEMDDNADLILVAGGTNDFGTSVKIGEITDKTDISFCGGLRILCEGLEAKYKNGKIVFITPINRKDQDKNDIGNSLAQYSDMIKKIAGEEYGFPVIDGALIGLADTMDIFLSDIAHPTPQGHYLIADAVSNELKNIL